VFALRSLRKTPGVATTIVVTLALAIGASTTMFSVVNGVLLNPLPVANSDRLVWSVNRGHRPYDAMSVPDFRDWTQSVSSFEATATWVKSQAALGDAGQPVQLAIADVTDNWFSMLGARLQLGRGFTAGEEGFGKPKIAVLSDALWRSQFGADKAVIGRSILLDGSSYTVVGVAAPRFDFPDAAQLWRPIALQPRPVECRGCRGYHGPVALLKRGATFERARAEVRAVAARLHTLYPTDEEGLDFDLQPLHEHFVGDTRAPLVILLAAVGCLLLIACTNVATLLLVRANGRAAEMGVRMALGAGRRRIATQLFVESALLALAGGVLGVLLAVWATQAIVALRLDSIPSLADISIDPRVLLASLFGTMAAGMLFGMAPALQAARTDIVGALKSGSRGASASRRSSRVRGALLITEVALVVPLLIGASLLVQSFTRLLSQPVGFDADRVVRFDLSLPICGTMWAPDSTCAGVRDPRYASLESRERFAQDLVASLRAMPGAENAAMGFGVPFTSFARQQNTIEIQGFAPPPSGQPNVVEQKWATPHYFATLGIPIIRGRDFNENDRADVPPIGQVAIVSEGAVKAYFHGQDPIGKVLKEQGTIIGVVGNTKTQGLSGEPEPAVYGPVAQSGLPWMTVLVRAKGDVTTAMIEARARVSALDPLLPVTHLNAMRDDVDASAARARLSMLLLSGFAAAALGLAVLGIYGLVAYTVRTREREVGIRIALGAQRGHVMSLIMRDGAISIALGIAVGVLLSLSASRALRSVVFGVASTDATTYVATAGALVVIAVLAAWWPARRAASIDPVASMRPE
jgi:putative ABC transport system permease protein